MKNVILVFFFLFSLNLSAQIVDIPDANFKAALIAYGVDSNNDGEIQVSEAEAENYWLNVESSNISSLDGIQSFVNIQYLRASHNNISVADFSQNTRLEEIELSFNQLTSIDIFSCLELSLLELHSNLFSEFDFSQNIRLNHIYIGENNIESIDVSQNIYLESLQIENNNLTELDLSNNPLIYGLNISYNPLVSLNIKNGAYTQFNYPMLGLDNLQFVCMDEIEIADHIYDFPNGTAISSYCSFTPGGEFFTIYGKNVLDTDLNGCDALDENFPLLKYNIINDNVEENVVSNLSGQYNFYLQSGQYTITPFFENSDYFTAEPESFVVNFPEDGDMVNQDFCVTPNGVHNDLEVVLVPYSAALPGFDSEYAVIYKNKGNALLSGTVTMSFDDDYMNLVSTDPVTSSQDIGMLSWDFTDLAPFETRSAYVIMTLNTPADSEFPLNSDDILSFGAEIITGLDDETPEDNLFEFNQTVVNSFDPNDKTCLEGQTLDIEKVGEYLHYIIRFENLGTANATNVVVKDIFDETKYDVSSLIPLDASHDFVTKISNGNVVEFIFENINLPFDDASNDGYLVFKVKTLPDLEVGDVIENDAEIYFDFNFPIITNNEQTIVVEEGLSTVGNNLKSIKVFPNPVSNILFIESVDTIDAISIYDMTGQLIKNIDVNIENSVYKVDINKLSTGLYFIEIQSGARKTIKKVIKN